MIEVTRALVCVGDKSRAREKPDSYELVRQPGEMHTTSRQLTSENLCSMSSWKVFKRSVCLHRLCDRNILRNAECDVMHKVHCREVLECHRTDDNKHMYQLPLKLSLGRRKLCCRQMSVQQRLYGPWWRIVY
jgi:hypothetical protein